MDSIKLKEELLKIEKKLLKEPTFKSRIEDLRALADKNDKAGLEFQLKQLAEHNQLIDSQKKSDPELIRVTEERKELASPYVEQLKYNKLQSRLVGLLLQELSGFGE